MHISAPMAIRVLKTHTHIGNRVKTLLFFTICHIVAQAIPKTIFKELFTEKFAFGAGVERDIFRNKVEI